MLYAFGSNGKGQLGLTHKNDIDKPECSHITTYSSAKSLKQVTSGGNHTLILGQNGHVEVCGSNESGQCGLGSFDVSSRQAVLPFRMLRKPGHSEEPTHIAQISATWSASVCLCQNGAVATAGEGLSGELGLGKGVIQTATATFIPDFPPPGTSVLQITSSLAHSVAVLDNGEVWGWGKGRKGQIGKPTESTWSPRRIENIPFPVVRAVCGKDFTCVVGDHAKGELLTIGVDDKDRFGLKTNVPHAVPGWKDIAASWGSVYVLLENGDLLGFGRNDRGQLPPPCLPPIDAIAAGSEHCLALTKAGKVLAWGWGEHGNCGKHTDSDGNVKDRWNEIEVAGPVRAVFAGCATSFIMTTHRSENYYENG